MNARVAEDVPPTRTDDAVARSADKWWILVSIGITSFMSALDGSIVNIILPIIQSEFRCDVAAVQWTVTVYLLVIGSLLLTFGRLGDLWGYRRVYFSGFGLFLAGSALCGMSWNVWMLVGVRAIQGVGAAMLFASSPALLTHHFPPGQRGQALGLQATMTYLGLAFGPALGGWLAHAWSWRAVFYINVPVGVAALACGAVFIPSQRRRGAVERFDYPGSLLFTVGLVALMLGLNQGHAWGWTSWGVLGTTALSVVLLTAFVVVERCVPHPMLDLSLFRRRTFSATVAAAVLNYIAAATVGFLMPFYLIQGRGLDTAHAGLLLTVQPLVMAVAAPLSGMLSDRVHSSLPSAIGMMILALGTLLLSTLGRQTPFLYVAFAFLTTGLGTGVFISPNNNALMGAAPRNRQGIAAGMLATARNVGFVLGVGISGAVLATMLEHQRTVFDATPLALRIASVAAVLGGLISLTRPEPLAITDTLPGALRDETRR